ncbi:MAG TPA: hypothetical protein VJH68_03550 [Candidatus Nanoarchaeia archaeon]|nr:hypothetical protein [Candidatus Nanoarchaeia archaeon]
MENRKNMEESLAKALRDYRFTSCGKGSSVDRLVGALNQIINLGDYVKNLSDKQLQGTEPALRMVDQSTGLTPVILSLYYNPQTERLSLDWTD